MGYSCNAVDHEILKALIVQLQAAFGDAGGSSNSWGTGDSTSFFETGRERADGAISGTVWGPSDRGPGYAKKLGSFLIKDGKVVRFPGSTKQHREVAAQAGIASFEARRNHLIGSGGFCG